MSLSLNEVHGGYGGVQILREVSLDVEPGSIVALVGNNGAGKTSTLRAVAGLLRVTSGTITVDGVSVVGAPPHRRAGMGIGHVPEGRQLFPEMSVMDNLLLGAYRNRAATKDALGEVFDLFPVLEERRTQQARSLSGGQAQMLAIGRAMMSRPRYLLLDEPSLGLSPLLVERMFEAIASLAARGAGVLLAEQNATRALAISQAAHVLENGRIALSGDGPSLLNRPEIVESYLGGGVH